MMIQGLFMKWGLVALLVIAPLQAWWFYSSGYDSGQFDLEADHNKALTALKRAHAKQLQEKQNAILEIEKAWLDDDTRTRTVYRDRVKTVTKVVSDSLDGRLRADCRLDDNGLQQINHAIAGK